MSRNKRQGAGDSRNQKKKTSAAGPRSKTSACPSCNAACPPDAAYCPSCGKPLSGKTARPQRDPVTMTLYSIIGIAAIGTMAGILYLANSSTVAPTPVSAPVSPAAPSAPAIDLSSMTPREAADRLFNRVMMAEEQGNIEEAERFAPMAIQAYDQVENRDADAHYHIGLIHAVTGDLENVRKQIGILKQFAPGHLLGLILEYDAAKQSGDEDAAAKAKSDFKAAYVTEVGIPRPEYEAHMKSIEKFMAEVAGR